ncbi:MAG: glucokinase [Methylibium sp.]|nr:glucokinase [Methylibium sp.]
MTSASPQYPWLVADIGGTHARFALVRGDDGAPTDIRSYKCRDFASPQTAALAYLSQVAAPGAPAAAPRRVALALATPIDGDSVCMTNSEWCVSRADMARALGADEVLLLNDFEALALALPQLATAPDETAVQWMTAARPDRSLPMAVIGPGTGLGVAGCVPAGRDWVALASEGGHVTAAAADDFEGQLLRVMRIEHPHVSAERMLSGTGLPLLHRAVCIVRGTPCDEDLESADITRRALDEGDKDCLATLDSFCAMLGGFAGNVALTLGARGGVFVAGGVAQKLAAYLARSRFRKRFEAKGRFESYLAAIATGVIVAPHPALAGAERRLAQSAPSRAST